MSGRCATTLEDIVAYVDGALPPAAAAAVERHLADCGACQAERDRHAAVWRALDLLQEGEQPLSREWLSAVERRILSAPRPRRRAWWAPAAAAAALVLTVGLLQLQPEPGARDEGPASQAEAPGADGQATQPVGGERPREEQLARAEPDADPLAELDPLEREIVANLELLEYYAQAEHLADGEGPLDPLELDVLDALDALEQLQPEELDEGS